MVLCCPSEVLGAKPAELPEDMGRLQARGGLGAGPMVLSCPSEVLSAKPADLSEDVCTARHERYVGEMPRSADMAGEMPEGIGRLELGGWQGLGPMALFGQGEVSGELPVAKAKCLASYLPSCQMTYVTLGMRDVLSEVSEDIGRETIEPKLQFCVNEVV